MEAEVIGALITGSTGIVGSVAAAVIAKNSHAKAEDSERKLKENVKEQEKIFIEISAAIKEFAKTVEDPLLKGKIDKSITYLDVQIEKIQDIFKDLDVWKEAGIWLENNRQLFIEKAVKDVLANCRELRNPGRDLDSEEKKEIFKKSLEKHIQWIILSLIKGIDIPLEISKFPHISDINAYKEAFTSIKLHIKQIIIKSSRKKHILSFFKTRRHNEKSKISKEAAEVLLDFVECLLKKYS